MTRQRLGELEPWLRPYAEYLYDVARYNGLTPRVTSVYRSLRQQAVLYERYLRGQSRFPAAPPGRSKHQHRIAFDMVTQRQADIGRFWRAMGGKWYESDAVHFEV